MTNRLAYASLAVAILAVLAFVPLFVFVPLLSVPATVLGVLARRNAGSGGIALAGIVVGAVVTALWVVLSVTFWIRYAH